MIPVSGYRKTFGRLVSDVQRILKDWHGEKYDPARIGSAVNKSVLDIGVKYRLCRDMISVSMVEGVYVYDVKSLVENARDAGSSIRSLNTVRRVLVDARDILLQGTLSEYFFVSGQRWTIDFVSAGKIMFSPPPGEGTLSAGGTLSVWYYGYPEPMTAAGDYPDAAIPPCDVLITLGSAIRMLEEGRSDSDFKQAIELGKDYTSEVRKLKTHLSKTAGRVADDMRPL
jgi:hypothetical protein